eukprot:1559225-Amphidinium_carterae.1
MATVTKLISVEANDAMVTVTAKEVTPQKAVPKKKDIPGITVTDINSCKCSVPQQCPIYYRLG